MLVTYRETSPVKADFPHRPGGIRFISLQGGEERTPDNFALTLVLTESEFFTPRHRHNFDQVRVMLQGEFSYDRDKFQRTGTIGYFCEGTYYQQQGVGQSEMLLLQAGGASGSGYMGFDALKSAGARLKERGEFHDGVFTWCDEHGKKHNQDGFEASWEEHFGRKLIYPRPRYAEPVIIEPDSFGWVQAPGAKVQARALGQFHERGLALGEIQLHAGGTCPVKAGGSQTLLFVHEGDGAVEQEPLRRHTAVKLLPGEEVTLRAHSPMRLLRLRLPQFDQELPL